MGSRGTRAIAGADDVRASSAGSAVRSAVRGGIGSDADRPDGVPKVAGRFAFSSDAFADGMLWGRTLRSPHPAARIRSLDTSAARRMEGVEVVVTAADVPGRATYGLEREDQPVFAADVVRFQGEPVAAVAAVHPELAWRAVQAIEVEYEAIDPLVDPEAALDAPPIHPDGNVVRHLEIVHGSPADVTGDVVVTGEYETAMQDQAFLGLESGLAIPDGDGGVDLYISTQWLHVDRDQVAACLGLEPAQVRLTLSGVGGAFGAREDIGLQVHLCLLALRAGRPVKMVYSREESFFDHVHRHPARMRYRHHARRDGALVKVEARLLFDGGAYASTSAAVLANGCSFAAGPYRVPHARVEGWAVRTNNPPCGAMRGFGVVQVCFAHEAQMDKLAAALDMDPVELRLRNALQTGDTLITGQRLTGVAPVRECIRAAVDAPLPNDDVRDPLELPGGTGRTADGEHVRRGVGVAVGFKNLMYAEGFDDFSTAEVRLELGPDGDPTATVRCAAAEVGQGFVTLAQQIVRTELGVQHVQLAPADTATGSAGSTSASRQTWMSGGAVQGACLKVRDRLLTRVARRWGIDVAGARREVLALRDGEIRHVDRGWAVPLTDALADGPVDETCEYHHVRTDPLNERGQGDAHVSFAFAAHRAVVDVDQELGLVRVRHIATGQDVGRALNPRAVVGQIEGGIAQGVGFAVMEEVMLANGEIRNPSFTDYLLPTALDMPPVDITLIEQPEPGAPYGAKGVGEPPTISSTAAVVAAIRDATGLDLPRTPVRPDDIALADT